MNKERPLCQHCGKEFSRQDALKRHQETVHGVRRTASGEAGIVFSEQIALEELSSRGYVVIKPEVETDKHIALDVERFGGEVVRIGLVSDTHFGSRYQQLSHLHTAYGAMKEMGVKVVLHTGDLTDGQGVYRGHEFELFCHGADAQADYAAKNYPRADGVMTYVIAGNHDESHWKTAGVDVCRKIAEKREDMEYLGFHGAYVNIGSAVIYLHHGSGGVAYARSYKMQKLIEQFAPQQKPNILIVGHYHTQCVLPMYRNVFAYQLPCFQSQTPYLKARGLYPEVGFAVVSVVIDENGIVRVSSEFFPFFVPKDNDF